MPADVYVDIESFANNLIFLAQANSVGYLIAAVIQDWIDDNPDFLDLPLDTGDVNEILKRLTGMTVATETDLNCYPRGYVDTILFDLDGNVVP
jgi:hypothetical protein